MTTVQGHSKVMVVALVTVYFFLLNSNVVGVGQTVV